MSPRWNAGESAAGIARNFTLRDREELSTRETANILGISESLVKVFLALREQLAGHFEERVAARR